MADATLIFADGDRNMDMFAAVGVPVVDPFLYVEVDGRRIAVVGGLEHEALRAADPGVELLDTEDFGRRRLALEGHDWISSALQASRRACRSLGVTRAVVNWDFPLALERLLREDGVEVVEDHAAFEQRRRVKTPAQLEGIRRAQAAADAAMAEAAGLIRACEDGLTSEQVRQAMQRVCDERGCDLGDEVIVAVNAQAANGHDSGSGPIRPGDTVLIDIWPRDRASRCFADMTRTFVAAGAEPPAELAEFWRLTREALDATLAAVRPGAPAREVYDRACEVYERAGQPTQRTTEGARDGFFHGLGHGVGLDVHEAPNLGLAGSDALMAGDVVTLEPGCYRRGFGGVRLEDLVLVTEDGCENLTRFPYDLAP